MSKQELISTQFIKLAASSAICGLTISFILGELVDQQGKLLLRQSSDFKLIPAEYAPVQPLKVLDAFVLGTPWEERLVQLNSIEIKQEFATVPNLKEEETKVQFTSAAPVAKQNLRLLPQTILPLLAKVSPSLPAGKAVDSVSAFAPINKRISGLSSKERIVDTIPQKQKTDTTKPVIVATPSELAPTSKNASEWIVKGKILNVPKVALSEGHFEVSVFSKIDPDGVPIGFPLITDTLPAGKANFSLKIPKKLEAGYIYGQYFAKKSGPKIWVPAMVNPVVQAKNDLSLVDLMWNKEENISVFSAAPIKVVDKDTITLSGEVFTMFSKGHPIPQEEVLIKIRGRKDAVRTDATGSFTLSLPKFEGTIVLEVLKKGYFPTLYTMDGTEKKKVHIEISSRDAINQFAQRFALAQSINKGVFVGQVDADVKEGYRAQLSLPADGPYYFDERGFPNADLRQTSKDGRFLFFNVASGVGYLDFNVKNEIIAPMAVSVIDGGEMVSRNLSFTSTNLRGRIYNPITPNGKLAPLGGALVRLSGSSDWITSDQLGNFSIPAQTYVKGENVNIEVSNKGFHSHRFVVRYARLEQKQPVNLFAFPANYLAQLGRTMDIELDPLAGVIVGKVLGDTPVRMDALSDHSAYNNARDFYFDKKGRLLGANNMTDPKYGTYIIFNVPKGRAMLQGSDANGTLRYQTSVLMSESSIAVLAE